MAKIGGRQTEVGIGIETTPGTAVAATNYFKWDSFSMQSMSDKIMLNSARGIRNKISNSLISKKYGKGSIEFVPTVDMLPYILTLAMGSRSTAARTGDAAVYDHTFTIQNANASMKTATMLVKQGGIQTERYANVVLDTMEITVDTDFAKCKCDLISGFPDTGSVSSSYTQDTLFSRNQMTAAFGNSFADATGTKATTTLTSNGTAPSDGETVTLGSTVYTAKTSLTGAAYEVLIGVSAATFLDNLKSAVNASAGSGTTYGTGTVAHPYLVATTNTDTTQIFEAIIPGTTANSLATTETSATLSFPGGTVNSGTPGTDPTQTKLVNFSLSHANSVLFDDAFLSGSEQPVAGGFVAGPLALKGSYTLHFEDTVELAKYQADTKKALIITLTGAQIGLVSYEQIKIKLGKLVLTTAPIEYQIDGLLVLRQEFEVQYDATDHEVEIVVTNTYAGTNYQ